MILIELHWILDKRKGLKISSSSWSRTRRLRIEASIQPEQRSNKSTDRFWQFLWFDFWMLSRQDVEDTTVSRWELTAIFIREGISHRFVDQKGKINTHEDRLWILLSANSSPHRTALSSYLLSKRAGLNFWYNWHYRLIYVGIHFYMVLHDSSERN
jgi:hypothetical protein